MHLLRRLNGLLAACLLSFSSVSAADGAAALRRLALLQDTGAVEQAYESIRDELARHGMEEGKQYELNYSSADGDMPTMISLLESMVEDRTEALMTLQAVTLQTAAKRAPSTLPIVFQLVSDPFVTGIGRSDTDKLPNITGVYFGDIGVDTQARRIALLQSIVPKARRIGILFAPSDSESVLAKDNMAEAARAAGLEVEVVGVAGVDVLPDSVNALLSRKVDAIQLVNSSLIASKFTVVRQAARRAGVPIFGHAASHVERGSIAAFVPNIDEGAREATRMVLRILAGEKPADIPLKKVQDFQVVLNLKAASDYGLVIPPEVYTSARSVLD